MKKLCLALIFSLAFATVAFGQNTATPTPTDTNTPTPTSTHTPTRTLTPTMTPRHTWTPTNTVAPSPTKTATPDPLKHTHVHVEELTILNQDPAPPEYSADCIIRNYVEPANFRDVCRCEIYFKYITLPPSPNIGLFMMCPDGIPRQVDVNPTPVPTIRIM